MTIGRLLLVAVIAGPIVSTSAARGVIIASWNSYLDSAVNRPALDATDNWLVLSTSDIPQVLIDSFVSGTGSPGFDAGSNLTFLYQVANNGDGSDTIDVRRRAGR